MKELDNATIALEIPNTEDISFKYMTPEEEARVDEITKNSFYRPKYLSGLKFLTQYDVREYHETHPEAPAKDVLSEMMKTYNPDLPSDILLDMAKVILEEWESLKTSKKELVLA
jgi:hypothetical protein